MRFFLFVKAIALADQKLPSGVYSALENAGIVGSILSSYNDVNLRWIARENWTYSLNFDRNNRIIQFCLTIDENSIIFSSK